MDKAKRALVIFAVFAALIVVAAGLSFLIDVYKRQGHDGAVFREHGDGHAGDELEHAAGGEEAHQAAGRIADPGLSDEQHGDEGDDGRARDVYKRQPRRRGRRR